MGPGRGAAVAGGGAAAAGNMPVGVLVGVSRQRREFVAEEIALAQALATSAAVAIRNARLYEETQRRLGFNETLVAVSQAIGSTLDLTEVLRRATREMVRALGGDMGVAWLLAPDRTGSCRWSATRSPRSAGRDGGLQLCSSTIRSSRRQCGQAGPSPPTTARARRGAAMAAARVDGAQVDAHAADLSEGRADRRLLHRVGPGIPSLLGRGAAAGRGHRAAGRAGHRKLAALRGRQAADGRAQADAGPAGAVHQAGRHRRAGRQHRPRDQQPAHDRARLRVLHRRAAARRGSHARGARPHPGGGLAGARHRARPAAVQPAARLHAGARRPQRGPRAGGEPWSAGRAR